MTIERRGPHTGRAARVGGMRSQRPRRDAAHRAARSTRVTSGERAAARRFIAG